MSAITRKQIIEDEAIRWGEEYVKNIQPAVDKNKEFIASILALNEANNQLRNSRNNKELQENQKRANEIGEKAISIWKEQNQLELALISTKKKNELATEGTNKALIKERTLLAETNKEIKLQARESLGLVSAYEKLNQQRKKAQDTLSNLLSAEKKNIAEIVIAQKEFDKLDARVKAVDTSIKNYSKNIGNYQSAFNGLSGTLREVIGAFGLVTGVALFGTIVKDVFSVIRDFDRQLIAVGKTTNIEGENLKQFGREVVALGEDLDGITVDGLIKSAEVAGQLGVTGTANILKFSEAIEKLKLTSNIISDEQVGQFAKFIEVSSDSFDNADKLASVITQLGNSFATTESEVLANATEIQKGIAVYETSAQGVLALGAATSTLGSEAEASRSAIQSTFSVINNAIATGKNLQQVLKLTGLTQSELSKQFNKDATGVFQKFVKGLADAKDEGQNLALVLNDVEITEKRAFTVIGALAANYGVLEGAINQANEEYIANAALNKEVAAASESIASIVADLRDKWEAYILTQNDVNNGTGALTKSLKFVRDNFKEIIDFVLKAGAVFLTYLGVIKTYNFVIAASTALQTAWTAGQIRFALATGIGTKSILAQAEAAKAATVSQNALNVATKATPWGLIIGLVAAAVAAYIAFNDTLSETEILINAVNNAQKKVQEDEDFYISERDKNREKDFKAIEDEIALRREKGENSKKLDDEEIKRKIEIVKSQENAVKLINKSEIDRTKLAIEESNKRLAQAQIEFDQISNQTFVNPFGDSVKDKRDFLTDEKAQNEALKAELQKKQEIYNSEYDKFAKLVEELDKADVINDAKAQAEANKKAIEARKKRLREIYDAEKKASDDLFKLQQFRLQVAIDVEQEIIDNEKGTFDSRVEALLESNQLITAKITEQAEFELRQLGKYNEDKGVFVRQLSDLQINELIRVGNSTQKLTAEQQLIYERYQNALTNAAKKGEADRQKLIDNQVKVIQDGIDAQNQNTDTALNNALTAENEKYKKSLEIAKDNFELIEQATAAHERRLLKITQDANKQKLQVQIDTLQKLLDDNAKLPVAEQISAEKRAKIENELSQYRKELSEINIESVIKANEAEVLSEKEKQERLEQLIKESDERTKELSQNLAHSLIDLANSIFDARVSAIESEMDYWNSYYDEQIELAGDDARQKDLLEKEKAKKQKELEKERKKELVKAAIFNRIISLAEIGINLAKTISAIQLAAMEIDALTPFAFGAIGASYRAVQIPLAIGVAAAQGATILATPLPKYKHGRKDGPEEIAVVGDGGVKEVLSNPDGSNPILTPNKPTMVKLAKKQMVHKSEKDYQNFMTKQILSKMASDNKVYTNYVELNASGGISQDLLDEMRLNRKVLEGKKLNVQVINKTDFGFQTWRMSNIKWGK